MKMVVPARAGIWIGKVITCKCGAQFELEQEDYRDVKKDTSGFFTDDVYHGPIYLVSCPNCLELCKFQ